MNVDIVRVKGNTNPPPVNPIKIFLLTAERVPTFC